MLFYLYVDPKELKRVVVTMESKIKVFTKLRESLRIASPQGNKGLNDEGDMNMKTIEGNMIKFKKWLEDDENRKDTYAGMLKQIEKYWKKLFADPIIIHNDEGEFTIIPQRTNNLLERFFRNEKRRTRKKQGCSSLNKTLKAILAKTPLVNNLKNEEYLENLLDGCSSLSERFSQIDHKLVRKQLDETNREQNKIPPEVKKAIREVDFPNRVKAVLGG